MLRGEKAEAASIATSFSAYYRTALRLVLRTSGLTFLSNMSDKLAIVFPTVIAAPRFFAGQISFGTLNQIRLGFLQLTEAALWFVSTYAQLAELVSQLERLSTLQSALERLASARATLERQSGGDQVVLEAEHVLSPAGEVVLGNVAFAIERGNNTAIVGPSGSGKTTLFRLLSGVWTNAPGRVIMPGDTVVFVPQRPYLPAGLLRNALCYPGDPAAFPEVELRGSLTLVGLAELAAKLDVPDDWRRRLSPGQQQRLAIARAILQRPLWLFLDEPTASLPAHASIQLHEALASTLPSATLITVTHDPAIAALHGRRIDAASPIAA